VQSSMQLRGRATRASVILRATAPSITRILPRTTFLSTGSHEWRGAAPADVSG